VIIRLAEKPKWSAIMLMVMVDKKQNKKANCSGIETSSFYFHRMNEKKQLFVILLKAAFNQY
jgi:hypothetical protein